MSPVYELFEQAMRQRAQIICRYRDHTREVCPVILGWDGTREKALVYQFGGGTSSKLPPGGEWRCLFLDGVTHAMVREGRWISGDSHQTGQTCVKIVDLDVNPLSPFNPRRRFD
jgi:hypothetical protein